MKKEHYIIKGIVHPERAQISIGPFHINVSHISSGKDLELKLNVLLNQVTLQIFVEEEWDVYDLRNIAKQFVSDQLAIIGFIKGYSYDIEIVQILNTSKDIDLVFG